MEQRMAISVKRYLCLTDVTEAGDNSAAYLYKGKEHGQAVKKLGFHFTKALIYRNSHN